MRNLTKAGYFAGTIIIISSIVRWFWLYPDQSQLILAVAIGIIVCGGSYVYQRLCELNDEIISFKKRVDIFGEMVSKMEWGK